MSDDQMFGETDFEEENQKLRRENEQLKKRLEHYKEVEAMNGDGKNE